MAKNIVVCLDGTWNRPERLNSHRAPTNVLKFLRALLPTGRDGRCQATFYDPGLGTGGTIDRIKGAFGMSQSDNILNGYRFIANNFDAGGGDPDEIFLLRFSSGAFTARSLGGTLGAVGLLETAALHLPPKAFALSPPKHDESLAH